MVTVVAVAWLAGGFVCMLWAFFFFFFLMLVVVAMGHSGCGGVGSRWSLNTDHIWPVDFVDLFFVL